MHLACQTYVTDLFDEQTVVVDYHNHSCVCEEHQNVDMSVVDLTRTHSIGMVIQGQMNSLLINTTDLQMIH